jgi:hypothetical protein
MHKLVESATVLSEKKLHCSDNQLTLLAATELHMCYESYDVHVNCHHQ